MNRIGKLTLLALTACGYSSYWPQAGPFAEGDTGDQVDPEVPCGTSDGAPVELTLSSQLPEPLAVFWMEPSSCSEQWAGELPPGAFGTWSTASGVVWFVRDSDGVVLRWFVVPDGVSLWTERVP